MPAGGWFISLGATKSEMHWNLPLKFDLMGLKFFKKKEEANLNNWFLHKSASWCWWWYLWNFQNAGVLLVSIGIFGILGNILSILVLSRSRFIMMMMSKMMIITSPSPILSMRNTFNNLLMVLACLDSVFLILAMLDYSIARGQHHNCPSPPHHHHHHHHSHRNCHHHYHHPEIIISTICSLRVAVLLHRGVLRPALPQAPPSAHHHCRHLPDLPHRCHRLWKVIQAGMVLVMMMIIN